MEFLKKAEVIYRKVGSALVDRALEYRSSRVVKVRSARLGAIKIALFGSIAIYVVLYEIAYQGKHFHVNGITGHYRIQLKHPTQYNCNPLHVNCRSNYSKLEDMPYCVQSKDFSGDVDANRQLECAYFDAPALSAIQTDHGFFLPSRLQVYDQVRSCYEDVSECGRAFADFDGQSRRPKEGGKASEAREVFVADLERFSLLLDHSFRENSDYNINAAEDYEMEGHWMDCERAFGHRNCVKRNNLCAHDECSRLDIEKIDRAKLEESENDDAAEEPDNSQKKVEDFGDDKPTHATAQLEQSSNMCNGKNQTKADCGGIFARAIIGNLTKEEKVKQQKGLPDGGKRKFSHRRAISRTASPGKAPAGIEMRENDIVSLKRGDVLTIKHLLFMAGINSFDELNKAGRTYRRAGMTIALNIHYYNRAAWHPWGGTALPDYTLDATVRPSTEFQHMYAEPAATDFKWKTRKLYKWHGINLLVMQTGEIVRLDSMGLIIVITASLSLMAVANIFLDMFAQWYFPEFEKAKYARLHLWDANAGTTILFGPDEDKNQSDSFETGAASMTLSRNTEAKNQTVPTGADGLGVTDAQDAAATQSTHASPSTA